MPHELSNFGERSVTPPDGTSDAGLLAAVRMKKLQAIEILYDHYAGIVMAVCLRIVRDRAVAEQIVETVFFDVWKHPDRFAGTLVHRLVSHGRIIAIRRRRSATPRTDPKMADAPRYNPEENRTEAPNVRWQRARTERALARVPHEARQIVEMVCLDAWDFMEVARRLNLTPAAIRQRFAVGICAFRNALRIAPIAANPLDSARFPLVRLDRVRILIVDDEPDARRVLARVLQKVGAFVTTAAGVSEAMALLPLANPEILLSDLAMPDEDGFDLIRLLRRGGRTMGDLPAIAVTAFADRYTRRDALLAGFQMHVAKPVDPHDLIAVVASLSGRTV